MSEKRPRPRCGLPISSYKTSSNVFFFDTGSDDVDKEMLGEKDFDINEEKKRERKWGLKIDISSDIPPENMSTGPTTHLSSAQDTDSKNIIHQ